jgi:thiol-disulfide isomerase/thioredoxin
MDYKLKYIKYKNKYLFLKKKYLQTGGTTKKPELHLYKAQWCGHCKHFKPIWEQLENSNLKNKINFITFDSDADKNEIKENNITGFPTIMLKFKNKSIEYQGYRTANEIEKFINQHIN